MNKHELENKLAMADFIVVNNGCGRLNCSGNIFFNGFDCPLKKEEEHCGSNEENVERAKKFIESNREALSTKCNGNEEDVCSENHQYKLDEILDKRKKNYGSFESSSLISQRLKAVIASGRDRDRPFEANVAEALEMICHKIARIVNGRDDYADSWYDIAGYATLVANRINSEEQK